MSALEDLIAFAEARNLRLEIERDNANENPEDGFRWRVHLHDSWPSDPAPRMGPRLGPVCHDVLEIARAHWPAPTRVDEAGDAT